MSRSKILGIGILLAFYYAAITASIFYAPPVVHHLTGASVESGPIYGFWSGFGGTLIFSALVLFPPWYYQHTCHFSTSCFRPGKYQAAGGTFKLCHKHHPDMQGIKPHEDMIHKLHKEWKNEKIPSKT